jgi:putative membrane protein
MPLYPLTLLGLLLALAIPLGMHPHHPDDWLLENVLAAAGVVLLVCTARRFPFSKVSYSLIFVFLVLHEIGAHYTYSEVPYDAWFQSWTGRGLNERMGWERNHYDRLVHFSYGFLLFYPLREFFVRVADARGVWGYLLPLDLTMSTSMLYELIEWGAASAFGSELGQAYLGTQGDPWDAHKDMALASLGAVLAFAITVAIDRHYDRDFQREWAHSLRIKQREPLGEAAIERLSRKADEP